MVGMAQAGGGGHLPPDTAARTVALLRLARSDHRDRALGAHRQRQHGDATPSLPILPKRRVGKSTIWGAKDT